MNRLAIMTNTWLFDDSPNTAVFTLRSIVDGRAPILRVSHDADDGAWQFLDGSSALREEEAMVIALSEILGLDNSVAELASLPLGWVATRENRDSPWVRKERQHDT